MTNLRNLHYIFVPLIVYLSVEVIRVDGSVGEIQINLPIHLCSEHFCDLLKCVPFKDCTGEVVKNGSVCGCCDSCVKILSEGEECGNIMTPVGGKPAAKCKSELTCDGKESPRKCKKIVTTNEEPNCIKDTIKRKMLLEKYADGIHKKFQFYHDIWIPDCDENGYYKPKQCKGNKCICMDADGGRLFGQQEKVLAKNMTCACSLAMYHKQKEQGDKWMTTLREHCTETGDYAELQCTDDICFCADAVTGQATSRVVKPSQKDLLSKCYKIDDFEDNSYLSRCEEQLVRENSVRYTFARKGIKIVRIDNINCDLDGSFAPRQCETNLCRCTDRKGFSLGSYAMDTSGTIPTSMNCRCARDRNDNDHRGAQYPMYKCQGNGNFAVEQTFQDGDDVFCVDEDGDMVASAKRHSLAITGTEHHDRCKAIIECLERINECTEIAAPPLTTSQPF